MEQKWKAVKFRPIMDIRKYFDRCFDTILAGKLAELGYEIETKWKADGTAIHSWDIKGIPDSVIEKNSRRSAEVDAGRSRTSSAKMKQENGHAPERLSAVARDKLGATSRREKREDLTLAECREYWNSRITPKESDAIAETIRRARRGQNPRPEPGAARRRWISPCGTISSNAASCRWEELATTAMEHSMGTASPDDIAAGGPAAGRHHADERRPAPVHHGGVAARGGRHHRLRRRRAGQRSGPSARPRASTGRSSDGTAQ